MVRPLMYSVSLTFKCRGLLQLRLFWVHVSVMRGIAIGLASGCNASDITWRFFCEGYSTLFCSSAFKSKPYEGYEFYFTVELIRHCVCVFVCFIFQSSNQPTIVWCNTIQFIFRFFWIPQKPLTVRRVESWRTLVE